MIASKVFKFKHHCFIFVWNLLLKRCQSNVHLNRSSTLSNFHINIIYQLSYVCCTSNESVLHLLHLRSSQRKKVNLRQTLICQNTPPFVLRLKKLGLLYRHVYMALYWKLTSIKRTELYIKNWIFQQQKTINLQLFIFYIFSI